MRIKTQFTVTMLLFGAILVLAMASSIITTREAEKADKQEKIAAAISQAASELGYLSNDYLIYRESQQLTRWRSGFAAFSGLVASLRVDDPAQQVLAANIRLNKDRMKGVFDSILSAPVRRSLSQDIDVAFLRASWSRMAVQTQALTMDASRLSLLLHQQGDKLTRARTILLYVMVGLLGAFILVSYRLAYGRILKSIGDLKAGTTVVGSGNLDYAIEARKNDEIGELSLAFNRMTTDLRAVTASKADLEQEIDQRKKAEEEMRKSEERLKHAHQIANVGSWEWDIETGGLVWSEEVYRQMGEQPGRYAPSYDAFPQHIHPEDRASFARAVEATLASMAPYDMEFRVLRPDGAIRVLHARGEIICGPDGRPRRMIGVCLDITERKRAEQSQVEYAAKLQEINKELESFNYSVSHDLKGLLRVINVYSQMILKTQAEGFDEETRRRFQVIRKNAEIMGNLIDDLLDFSRLGRQVMARGSIDMQALVGEIWQELLTLNPRREMTLNIDHMPAALGDYTLIRQVYSNLLANAVKFTQEREAGVIEAGSYLKDNERVYYVRDNGVGFDMKLYDKLFGVFQHLHSDEEYKGTGIGLALVQRIVHRHGGQVWAEGKVGEGACFYFTLP